MQDNELQEILMKDYVRIPKTVLKLRSKLKSSEYQCLQFIWEKTGGWNKTHDNIAISQFMDEEDGIGMKERTVQSAIRELEKLGLISIQKGYNGINKFTVNIEKVTSFSNQTVEKTTSETPTQGVQKTTQGVQNLPQGVQKTVSRGANFAPTQDKHKNIYTRESDTRSQNSQNQNQQNTNLYNSNSHNPTLENPVTGNSNTPTVAETFEFLQDSLALPSDDQYKPNVAELTMTITESEAFWSEKYLTKKQLLGKILGSVSRLGVADRIAKYTVTAQQASPFAGKRAGEKVSDFVPPMPIRGTAA